MVISWIGSFTTFAAATFIPLIRKTKAPAPRVFLQDGSADLATSGNWPLSNRGHGRALFARYDYQFSSAPGPSPSRAPRSSPDPHGVWRDYAK